MRKRWFLAGMVLLLVPGLLSGCGVAQEQHDAVVAERDAAQAEAASLTSDLDVAQASVSELTASLGKAETGLEAAQTENSELTSGLAQSQSELEAVQKELEELDAEYEAFKSDVNSTWNRLDNLMGLQWNITAYWSAAAKGDEDLIEQRHVNMVTFVDKVGDSTCTSLWEQAMSAAEKGQDDLYMESFAALMDRSMYLITGQAKAIRGQLAE